MGRDKIQPDTMQADRTRNIGFSLVFGTVQVSPGSRGLRLSVTESHATLRRRKTTFSAFFLLDPWAGNPMATVRLPRAHS